jgi:hypothetical protein
VLGAPRMSKLIPDLHQLVECVRVNLRPVMSSADMQKKFYLGAERLLNKMSFRKPCFSFGAPISSIKMLVKLCSISLNIVMT